MTALYFILLLAGLVAFVGAFLGPLSPRIDSIRLVGLGLALVTLVAVIQQGRAL